MFEAATHISCGFRNLTTMDCGHIKILVPVQRVGAAATQS